MSSKKSLDLFFEYCEDFIYIVIGALLLFTSLFLIYNIVISFFHFSQAEDTIRWVVEIIDKTLLLLMIVEIFYTLRVSFKEHVLNAEPFLIVALIAAIRRILVISVETAYIPERFDHHMIEISILGLLIFIFVVSFIILRRQAALKS